MDYLNDLRKYIVEGSIQEELENNSEPLIETKVVDDNKVIVKSIKRILAAALLNEDSYPGQIPACKVDPKIAKTQKLTQIINDMSYKLNSSDEDDEINTVMKTMIEPIIKIAVTKLYELWLTESAEKDKKDSIEASVKVAKVEPGDQVVSPQGVEYKVESISLDKILLKETKTNKVATVDIDDIKKWKK